jgi:nucleoside-diphosphate kinase
MSSEQTFLMVKPDGVARGLTGETISRVEKKGLTIAAMKLMRITRELAEKHYGIHKGKPFYDELVEFITSGPVVAMVIEGPNAIRIIRTMAGATNPVESVPGSIRGDLALTISHNVVHSSDGPETARFEVGNFFSDQEILSYQRADTRWL